jgi:KRAB domain-containing zinc finger protein
VKHVDAKPFICVTCGKAFKHKVSLEEHEKRGHKEKPEKLIVKRKQKRIPCLCDICGKNFETKQAVTEHYKTHVLEKKFQCKICSNFYRTAANLRIHKTVHNERTLKCPNCEKYFKNHRDLKQHRIVHEEAKNYCCEECGKSFTRRQVLARHIRSIHSADSQKYACSICDKKFNDLTNMKNHQKRHKF